MKLERDFELSMLFDLYSGLLTEKQKNALDMYINLDYSLSEIAENTGATRQAAMDAVKRGEQRLTELEKCLGLYAKYRCTMEALDEIEGAENEVERKNAVARIRSIWEEN